MQLIWAIVAGITAVNIFLFAIRLWRRRRARVESVVASDPDSRRRAISIALLALQSRTNEDAFVIFEDAESHKLVQFAGGASHPLLLDMPIHGLDPVEVQRAEEFFGQLGVQAPATFPMLDKPNGKPLGMIATYDIELPRGEVERATELTLRIFEQVYQAPPDFKLLVSEN